MTLTLDAARAIVRQPGLHLSAIVDAAIDRMMTSPDWTDQNEATALQRAIRRDGRPVRHDEMHDFDHTEVLHGPSVLAWAGMALGVVVAWMIILPLFLRGLQAVSHVVWGM